MKIKSQLNFLTITITALMIIIAVVFVPYFFEFSNLDYTTKTLVKDLQNTIALSEKISVKQRHNGFRN